MTMTTLTDLSEILGAELHGSDAEFMAVSTDSRHLASGDLFFALRGERFNAGDFVDEAAQQGAVGAVVDELLDCDIAQLKVADTRAALGIFARAWRARNDIPVIAITGSNGKTTVKELTAGICRSQHETDSVLATEGNLNNEIGLPLTLLNLRSQHQVAIVEMGASHAGEIALLADIAAPEVAVITNVARAHIEGFGSIDAVAAAKGELLDQLTAGHTAVLNCDDDYFESWRERAGAARVVSFGLSPEADYRAEDIQPIVRKAHPGFAFRLVCPAGQADIALPLAGRHNVSNALAAAAAAMAAGASLDDVRAGLALAHNVAGRLRAFRLPSGAMLFDDTYNANPDSVAAAIAALAEFKGAAWLVLGDMAELGDDAVELHQATGRLARVSGAEALFCTGELGREIVAGFGPGARWFETADELEIALREELIPGRNVLIKASRCMQLDRLVQTLRTETEL